MTQAYNLAILANYVNTSGQLNAASGITPALGTGNNVQHNSLGIGVAATGNAGEIVATGNVIAGYSDDQLKTNLGNIENALDKLRTLSGFYYEPNQTAIDLGYQKEKQVGVSAQKVQAVLPEAVKPAPVNNQYLTVQYEKLCVLLIEAVKELDKQVQELKGNK